MRIRHLALRGPVFAVLAVALVAAGLSGPARDADAREGFEIAIGDEDVPIEQFLRMISDATEHHLVWNPNDKNIRGKKIIGSVHLKGVSAEDLFGTARSLLTFYELVIIPVGPTREKIHLVMDARQTSSILKLKPEYVVLTDENLSRYETMDGYFVTTTIRVKHMEQLRNARNALTRLVTGQNIGNVTEVPAAHAFVITDFAPNVCAIYRLLREMDVPSERSSTAGGVTVAVRLEHARAREIASTLAGHFLPPRTVPPAQRQGQAPTEARTPRISADQRTNQILITGTREQVDAVKQAIALLDVDVVHRDIVTHLHRVKNIQAGSAVSTLSTLIATSPSAWGGGPGPNAVRPSVVYHDETQCVIITGIEEDVSRLRGLLEELDVSRGGADK